MNWSLDRSLQRRMAVTLLALGVLTLAFGAGLSVLVAWGVQWLSGVFGLALGTSTLYALGALTTLVGGGVVLHRALQQDAAETFDADEVAPDEYPRLHAAVARLAQAADLPLPSVHVADRDRPFAMTTGLSTDDAKLVVSTGLLDALDDEELDAVVAHELAHVKNRDATVMTLVELPLSSARNLGRMLQHSGGVHFALLGVAAGSYLFWGLGRALVASLSRSRELAADRGASALLGDPAPLASALDTLAEDLQSTPETDARATPLAALSVVPAPRENSGPALTWERRRPVLWGLRLPVRRARHRVNDRYVRPVLATHPATDERIDRLRALERTQEGVRVPKTDR
ncbi:M48 family metalloprotease [Halomarina oriensis]|uniref:M48 family metalloprotease n=1 Tax=Halomarina oriensis TaxID=671145 RepID=A0A6B0GFT3_9EURY|nr:M48 family metalloprotease [Halomarina oriensis]MWG33564.1 M48 family metalloprotease [Halomarina oriensis]